MISIIAALAKNRVIGAHGTIPWDIPEDKAHFRKLTVGNVIIMGRKTYESIGFPLPNRSNIVVSRSADFSGENLMTAPDLDTAVALAYSCASKDNFKSQIFLCGGEKIYSEGLDFARRLYLTELDDEYQGDTFFPHFSKKKIRLVSHKRIEHLRLSFNVYERLY